MAAYSDGKQVGKDSQSVTQQSFWGLSFSSRKIHPTKQLNFLAAYII